MVEIPNNVIKFEVGETVLIEVSKELYRTVQSFINSSKKPVYVWNVGVRTGNKITFVKTN
jgi:hypothetical protein